MEPVSILREELAAARAAGVDFATAWGPAVAVALRPGRLDPIELARWEHALTVTAADWADAYEQRPASRLARAAAAVAA